MDRVRPGGLHVGVGETPFLGPGFPSPCHSDVPVWMERTNLPTYETVRNKDPLSFTISSPITSIIPKPYSTSALTLFFEHLFPEVDWKDHFDQLIISSNTERLFF